MGRIPVLLAALVAGVGAAPAEADPITPVSSASPPVYATTTTFDIPYTATDDGGPGVGRVDLYAKAPGDPGYLLVASDNTPDTPTFSYTASAGDGSYGFYTVAEDTQGVPELPPAGDDGTTLLDTAAPQSGASAPASSGGGPLTISYTAADSGSGVASVELWAKAPGDSGYSLAGTDTTPDSPSFTYNPTAGNGTYGFFTVASDRAGSREPQPASPDATTNVQSTSAPPPATSQSGGSGAGVTIAQLPAAPTPAKPGSTQQLVAAVLLNGRQRLGQVLRRGLGLQLYAYRAVSLRLALLVPARTAKALGMRDRRVAVHAWQVITPAIYPIRLRLKQNAIRRLRGRSKIRFEIRSRLSTDQGSSSASNRFTLSRG
jgi:hypothetical protein